MKTAAGWKRLALEREVEAAQAASHWPALLDAVERGESLVIMRAGRVVARLVPEAAGAAAVAQRRCVSPHLVASGIGGTSDSVGCACRDCRPGPF
jgi:antitoxin (DNA-binding transcriptional repressor) of toxin-antitoxin stability system